MTRLPKKDVVVIGLGWTGSILSLELARQGLLRIVDLRNRIDGGRASIDAPNKDTGLAILNLLLERGADPNMQLFFKPANVRGIQHEHTQTLNLLSGDG